MIVRADKPVLRETKDGNYLACCGKRYVPFSEYDILRIDWNNMLYVGKIRKALNIPDDGIVNDERLLAIDSEYRKRVAKEKEEIIDTGATYHDLKAVYFEKVGKNPPVGTTKKELEEKIKNL